MLPALSCGSLPKSKEFLGSAFISVIIRKLACLEEKMISWFSKHKFQAHLSAFLLMVISSIGMIFLMRDGSSALTWLMIAIFAIANLLAVFIK